MITRNLLAALVGLSLAAGTLSVASAQTTAPTTTQSASPSDATALTTAAKSDVTKKPVHKHHARMTSKTLTHRKHVSLRGTTHVAATPIVGKQVADKRVGIKVAHHASKRVRLSHLAKRGTPKHV